MWNRSSIADGYAVINDIAMMLIELMQNTLRVIPVIICIEA